MMNQDYTLIQNTWQHSLIKFTLPNDQRFAHISYQNRYLFAQVGLPNILSNQGKNFHPFSIPSLVDVNNQQYYLLGDLGSPHYGRLFLGLEQTNEEVYLIQKKNDGNLEATFMNQSLYQFLMCMAIYNNYAHNNYDYSIVDPEKVKSDYYQLENELTKVDHLAMEDRSLFWADIVYYLKIGVIGDYLFDNPYDDEENPEDLPSQEEVNKKDLPF